MSADNPKHHQSCTDNNIMLANVCDQCGLIEPLNQDYIESILRSKNELAEALEEVLKIIDAACELEIAGNLKKDFFIFERGRAALKSAKGE